MASEDPSDYYGLERHRVESQRLDVQHKLSSDICNYIINPEIERSLPPDALIADIGTGTGIWLFDAAKALPESAKLVGYDISNEQFPEKANAPGNITFEIADLKKPFPSHLHGKYDLVHCRALNLVILPSEYDQVVQYIVQLVKPGGFLQWSEGDLSNLRCLRGTAKHTTFTTLPGLFKTWDAIYDRTSAVWRERSRAIEQQGLRNAFYDTVGSDRDPASRDDTARIIVKTVIAWAKKTSRLAPDEIKAVEEGVEADFAKGAYTRCDLICITGQRPLV